MIFISLVLMNVEIVIMFNDKSSGDNFDYRFFPFLFYDDFCCFNILLLNFSFKDFLFPFKVVKKTNLLVFNRLLKCTSLYLRGYLKIEFLKNETNNTHFIAMETSGTLFRQYHGYIVLFFPVCFSPLKILSFFLSLVLRIKKVRIVVSGYTMQYGEIISDQAASGVAVLRDAMTKLDVGMMLESLKKNSMSILKRHGKWILLLFLFKVVYRFFFGRARKSRRLKANKGKDGDDSDSDDRPQSFIEGRIPAPACNQTIETDDVVVVNRNDRFLEVYSKRKNYY
eukprot:gene5915-4230_t